MKAMRKVLIGAAIGAGVLAVSAVSASASIVCSGNVCWHTKDRYHYPRDSRVVVHADSWRHGPSISFREHEGRGYWHGDSWKSW